MKARFFSIFFLLAALVYTPLPASAQPDQATIPTLDAMPKRVHRQLERDLREQERQIKRDTEAGFEITPFPGEVPYIIPRDFAADASAIINWQTQLQRVVDLKAEIQRRWQYPVHFKIVDSGVDGTHTDLVRGFTGQDNYTTEANIPGRHGTHVAGIIVALCDPARETGMVTYESDKTLLASGSGQVAWAVQRYRAELASTRQLIAQGRTVIDNNSWGTPPANIPDLEAAINAYAATGAIIVAAAGNNAGPVGTPANIPVVYAITALDQNLKLASYSNSGPEIDGTSGGSNIVSTLPGNQYGGMSGTSMAAPAWAAVVAGYARGIWGPDLLPDAAAIQAYQRKIAQKIDDADVKKYGPGYVFIRAILDTQPDAPGGGNPPPPPPPPAPDPVVNTITTTIEGHFTMRYKRTGDTDWRLLAVPSITATITSPDNSEDLYDLLSDFVTDYFINRGITELPTTSDFTHATWWTGQFMEYIARQSGLNLQVLEVKGVSEYQAKATLSGFDKAADAAAVGPQLQELF